MTAFRRFGPEDIVDSVLTLHPEYSVASGTTGWHGGPAGSGSIFVYGGARSRPGGVLRSSDVSPSWGSSFSYNLPSCMYPMTSSIRLVTVVPTTLSSSQISTTQWGEEHWDVIQGLYEYYSQYNAEYMTSSYDHYCLRFSDQSRNVGISSLQLILSSSFTIEARIKPFLTQSASGDFTILSRTNSFLFGITGSTGRLFFSSSQGSITSSFGAPVNRWSHVAVRGDSLTGTFTIDLQDAGSFPCSASFGLLPSQTASLTAGAKWAGNLSGPTTTTEGQAGSGSANTSFCGLMNELRVWNVCRTQAQLSASYRTTLSGNSSASLPSGMAFYARFHDGPNSSYYGYLNGSSSIDEMTRSTGTPVSFVLQKFNDRSGPIWHPSDDQTFVTPKQIPVSTSTEVFSSVNRMTVIDIPSMFYGRQIATGSVEVTDQAFTSLGIKRVLVDDGRGGLYISGSICSSSLANQESYAGVKWNKVGNVFYNEGLIVIRDPALLDFGGIGSANPGASSHDPINTFQLKFRGVSELPTKTLMCRVDPGEMNCSTNGSFYVTGSDGNRERRHTSGSVWITTVMVYDENMEPVMVIRPAQPIRHRERDRLNIKTKMDF